MELSLLLSLTIPAVRAPMMVLLRRVDPPEWSSLNPIVALSARLSRKAFPHPLLDTNAVRKAEEASLR